MVRKSTVAVLLLAIIFFSCKKSKDVGSPSVQINTPATLSTFNVFDTIKVNAHVSDANQLTVVSIYIINSQGVQVLPSSSVAITSHNMTFTSPYILSDIHMLSGQYNIVIYASNGTNTTYAYRQI